MKNFFFLLIATCFLSSCKQETIILRTESPDKKAALELHANRSTPIGTWELELEAKTTILPAGGSLKFESESSEISDKTVHFNWTDNQNCSIEIEQPDGENKRFHLFSSDKQTLLEPVL